MSDEAGTENKQCLMENTEKNIKVSFYAKASWSSTKGGPGSKEIK